MSMIDLCKKLYKINRSITGEGVRKSLKIIKEHDIPINFFKIKSGTKVFDWTIPHEWNLLNAYVINLKTGKKVIDLNNHNLHVISYSAPIDDNITFNKLNKHLHYKKDMPDAIPYVTSYYKKRWGFCLTYNDYLKLDRNAMYHAVIDSSFNPDGNMDYGEVILPGKTQKEVLFTTYICHPQMCNNELSGPAVWTYLIKHIMKIKNRKYTYRFVIAPETIGSIAYISKNIKSLKKNVNFAFNLTCLGDERCFSYLQSRKGNTNSDRIAKFILDEYVMSYKEYNWISRGSDERQYCAPNVDIPMCSIMRSKFGEYPEYHTSLDNFDLVTEQGLTQSLEIYKEVVNVIEENCKPITKILCEPNLGSRNLYPTINTGKKLENNVKNLVDFLSYCDGSHDILDIAKILNINFKDCVKIKKTLYNNKIINI